MKNIGSTHDMYFDLISFLALLKVQNYKLYDRLMCMYVLLKFFYLPEKRDHVYYMYIYEYSKQRYIKYFYIYYLTVPIFLMGSYMSLKYTYSP